MVGNPDKEPLERRIFLQAQAFHLVARQVLVLGRPGGANTALPGVMNSAFASELYFKCLIEMRSKQRILTHNLNKLFKLLPAADRDEIERRFDEKHGDENRRGSERMLAVTRRIRPWKFRELLAENADAFTEWRYLYENPNTHFSLIPLPDILRDYIIHVRPEFSKIGYVLADKIPN